MKNSQILLMFCVLSLGSVTLCANVEGQRKTLSECLKVWGKSPFKSDSPYKVVSSGVKIMGIGNDPEDKEITVHPQLVLVKPSVNVMTKTTYRLMNPNGWYCFKANVAVLGKLEIIAHCTAHLASASEGTSVAGSNEGTNGVSVLGKLEVKREGCDKDESSAQSKN